MPKSDVPHLPHSTQVPRVFTQMENQLEDGFRKKEELRWAIFHRDREYANSLGDPQIGTVVAATKEEAERKAGGLYFLPSGAWAVSEQHLPELRKQWPEESLQVQDDFGISF
jgi:hypothetical protein